MSRVGTDGRTYPYQRPEEDRYNFPEEYLRARIVGALGGRGAEEIVYCTRTTGAENDIEQATDIARRIVTRWGMSDELDMVALAPRESPFLGEGAGGSSWGGAKPYSEETAQKIDAEEERIIRECHEREPDDFSLSTGGARRACTGAPRDAGGGRDPGGHRLAPGTAPRRRQAARLARL